MSATMVEVSRKCRYTNPCNEENAERYWGVTLSNERMSIVTEYVDCNHGVLILREARECYDTPQRTMELLAGCFEKGSNLNSKILNARLVSHFEQIEAIVMFLKGVPVFVSRYDNDFGRVFESWEVAICKKNQKK